MSMMTKPLTPNANGLPMTHGSSFDVMGNSYGFYNNNH